MGPRLLEENCENPEFCLVYEEEEIIDGADQKAIYVEEEMGCVTSRQPPRKGKKDDNGRNNHGGFEDRHRRRDSRI